MRKIIVSNLLLIMFLVGAASGFFVGSIGWWGLYQGSRDLDQLQRHGAVTLNRVSEVQALVLRSQTVFHDTLKKQRLSASDKGAVVHADGEIRQRLARMMESDPANHAYWEQVRHHHERVAASHERVLTLLETDASAADRHHVTETMPLANELAAALHLFLPNVVSATQQAYERSAEFNQNARNALIGMSLLATVFFCLTASLTYREAMERRRKSAQLDREHALFRTLFEGTSDGVILRSKERLIDCNRAALKMFGVPNVELFSKMDLSQLQPAEQPEGFPSHALYDRMHECLHNGSQRFEWQFKSIDGKEFPAEVAIDCAHLDDRDIVQLTIRDISRRKQAERSMLLANQAFENSLEGMTITDDTGNILTVNNAFTTITGYSRDDVVGRNPRMLSSGRQTQEFYKEMWDAIERNGKWQGEIWNIRKNGDIYPQWLNISRVRDDRGNVINYVGVFSDISERKSAEERILHQVYYDQLTELPNRVLFADRLNQVMSQAKRHAGKQFAVMFLDLDRFKLINDSLGHDAGDQLLQQAAHRLRGTMRETDTVARMGGDEFTVVLSEVRSAKDACGVAQKILDAFRSPFLLNNDEVYVTVSIGISIYPDDGTTTELLIKNADMAMYRAKSAGGSWFELYDEGLGTAANQRLLMETALHKAVERQELELHYQPQFDCGSGKLVGFEALLRWRHPERGLLAPDAFLSIAEETGLIVPIGEWVLRTACAQAQVWRKDFPGHRLMAVNLSGRQFQNADLARQVLLALQQTGLPHFCLELEITESVVMHDLDASVAIMNKLSDLGVQFSIDDFGTGHSSLAYLKKLPLHALKIDRSFIRDIATDQDDAAIVSAIVAMASKLGLRVVAEGIEEKAQMDLLKGYKGIVGQGYLTGRPLKAEAATRVIAEGRPKAAFT